MLECWGLGRTLWWRVIGNRGRGLGTRIASWHDSFPAFDLLLLHCDRSMCTMELVVESFKVKLVTAQQLILLRARGRHKLTTSVTYYVASIISSP
jgi:hypothetical protein